MSGGGLSRRPPYDRGVIDLRLVRENPDVVRASQRARGADESVVDALLAADAARREVGPPRRRPARRSRRPPRRRSGRRAPEERPAVLERAKALSAEVKEAEEAQRAADAALRAAHLQIPNVVADGCRPAVRTTP